MIDADSFRLQKAEERAKEKAVKRAERRKLSAATIKGPPQALRRDEHGTRLPPQTRDHLAALRP